MRLTIVPRNKNLIKFPNDLCVIFQNSKFYHPFDMQVHALTIVLKFLVQTPLNTSGNGAFTMHHKIKTNSLIIMFVYNLYSKCPAASIQLKNNVDTSDAGWRRIANDNCTIHIRNSKILMAFEILNGQ